MLLKSELLHTPGWSHTSLEACSDHDTVLGCSHVCVGFEAQSSPSRSPALPMGLQKWTASRSDRWLQLRCSLQCAVRACMRACVRACAYVRRSLLE
eukprot:2449612-Amphidinium_carterae.1